MLIIRRVVGHSMLPGFPPGELVVGWRWYRRLKVGQVVVLRHEGKEKIKRIADIHPGARYFVLGDNSDASTDSRYFGWIPGHEIKAVVIWPRR